MAGRPKGLLLVGGEPIAARSLRLFRALFDGGALVVANDAAPYAAFGAPVVPDLVLGKGAPGGVHAALSAARTGWVFTAACDMPFVSEAGIALLAERRAGVEAVLVRWQGRLEPLHALWSRACLPLLSRLLAEGDPSLWSIRARGERRHRRGAGVADRRSRRPRLREREHACGSRPSRAHRATLVARHSRGPSARDALLTHASRTTSRPYARKACGCKDPSHLHDGA